MQHCYHSAYLHPLEARTKMTRLCSTSSSFNSDCTLDAEITHRVTAANSAFQQLRQVNIWPSRAFTLFVKKQFFQCIVMSVLLYSGETWAVVKQHISPLAVFQMNCLRRICGISLRDHVPP